MTPHSVIAGPDSAERAQRLLRGMHKVFSHDLPNQVVVLQSLLRLLQVEEIDRLSPDGREYVARLASAATKAGAQVRFLKEMSRLHSYQPRLHDLALPSLARELEADLNQPGRVGVIEYQWHWQRGSIRVDQRTFCQGLLGLLQEQLERGHDHSLIQGTAHAGPACVQLEFCVTPARGPAQPGHDTLLARELLAVSAAELTLDTEQRGRFSILVPG